MNRRHLIAAALPLTLASGAIAAEAPHKVSEGITRGKATPALSGSIAAAAGAFVTSGYGAGLSVAAVRNDRLIFAKGYGTANLETAAPVTTSSVFRAGSITKQFTAAAIMRLVEAGKLDLDAPAAKYVSEMSSLGPITVRMLLHQISGLHNYSGRDFAQQQRIDHTPKQMLDYILAQRKPTDFPPAERFEYSNSNYFVLGVIVERVGGRPLQAALEDLIRAANLTQTAPDRSADVVMHRAAGYSLIEGQAGHYRNAEYLSMDNAGGAGVLRSTPTDLAKWHQALFAGRVVRDTSVRQMIEIGMLSDGRPVLRDDPPIAQGKPAYGFGLEVGFFDGRKAIGHGGAVPGYTSYVVTFPEERLSAAVMINADPNAQMPFATVLRAILALPKGAAG
jgi:D-alanyl-D-alanine carboxypeptidase